MNKKLVFNVLPLYVVVLIICCCCFVVGFICVLFLGGYFIPTEANKSNKQRENYNKRNLCEYISGFRFTLGK